MVELYFKLKIIAFIIWAVFAVICVVLYIIANIKR